MVLTNRDSLLIMILSPTRSAVWNNVFVPITVTFVVPKVLAVPTILDGWNSTCVIAPFEDTFVMAAAAPIPNCICLLLNDNSSPIWYPLPALFIAILPNEPELNTKWVVEFAIYWAESASRVGTVANVVFENKIATLVIAPIEVIVVKENASTSLVFAFSPPGIAEELNP